MVFQETHLAGHSFTAEGKRHGYRVWSVPAQQGQDALGRRTVNGGLTCVVKDGLPAYLVNSVSEDAGEALILQCGQWRVRGLWQRPSFVSAGGLTQHLLDAATAGYGVLALGDFNHLPTEGPLVAAGSAKAFAAIRVVLAGIAPLIATALSGPWFPCVRGNVPLDRCSGCCG